MRSTFDCYAINGGRSEVLLRKEVFGPQAFVATEPKKKKFERLEYLNDGLCLQDSKSSLGVKAVTLSQHGLAPHIYRLLCRYFLMAFRRASLSVFR